MTKHSKQEIEAMQETCNEHSNQYSVEFETAYEYILEARYWLGVLGADFRPTVKGNHYVYFAFDDDKLIYIGSGKGDRYKHVTSGISHNKELNRLYFQGISLYVCNFVENASESEAQRIESLMIKLLNPKANSKDKPNNSFVRNYDCLLDAWKRGALSAEKLKAML